MADVEKTSLYMLIICSNMDVTFLATFLVLWLKNEFTQSMTIENAQRKSSPFRAVIFIIAPEILFSGFKIKLDKLSITDVSFIMYAHGLPNVRRSAHCLRICIKLFIKPSDQRSFQVWKTIMGSTWIAIKYIPALNDPLYNWTRPCLALCESYESTIVSEIIFRDMGYIHYTYTRECEKWAHSLDVLETRVLRIRRLIVFWKGVQGAVSV